MQLHVAVKLRLLHTDVQELVKGLTPTRVRAGQHTLDPFADSMFQRAIARRAHLRSVLRGLGGGPGYLRGTGTVDADRDQASQGSVTRGFGTAPFTIAVRLQQL